MIKEQVFVIEPDGTIITLYNDDSIVRDIPGNKAVTRASNVEYDPKTNKWKVYLNHSDGTRRLITKVGFDRRDEAIDFEVLFLNQLLCADFDPKPLFESKDG